MANLFLFPPQPSAKLNIPNDEPIYRVRGAGFFDGETLLPEMDATGKPTLIAYDDEPNFNLLPMNELALKKVEQWIEKLEAGAAEVRASKEHGSREYATMHDTMMRDYRARIADSGRFNSERVQTPILSNHAVKGKARVIDTSVVETPQIRNVKRNGNNDGVRRDQTDIVNG